MSLPDVVARDEWLSARVALLAKEKELTRARDALNAERRRLPMVRIEKDYVFEGPDGTARLIDLFEGRRQLVIQHIMFGPDWDDACPSCTASVDELSDGLLRHLRDRETTFAAVSRAPLAKIEEYRQRMGWTLPWYSSFGSDFNYDFHVTMDDAVTPVEYNYRSRAEHERRGKAFYTRDEQPGLSCFLREGDQVFHTYSAFARGAEAPGGSHYYLDLTALGRQEAWEEPKGRAVAAVPG
jgi:predicted dithiol-disulfide oxidoreductase (DUF899 family)